MLSIIFWVRLLIIVSKSKSRIARGGMATVYKAEDRRLDRLVAVKIMHPHLADSLDFTTLSS